MLGGDRAAARELPPATRVGARAGAGATVTVSQSGQDAARGSWAARRERWRQGLAPLLVLLAMAGLIAVREPAFLGPDNLRNVLTRTVPLALIAIGQTLVILCGQIDLGVGSVMALAAVAGAIVLRDGGAVALAVIAALLVGCACGAVNGVVTTRLKVPSFVVTLAMMGLARGLSLAATEGRTVSGAFALNELVRVTVAGLPLPVWVLAAVALAAHGLLSSTVFGRHAYATGANPAAARLSGVKVDRNLVLVFALCGLLVGAAGAVECGRNSSAAPTMGELVELDAIAAVVIGGASLAGGQGGVGGTLLGVAIMAVLRNGCNLLHIPNEWEKVVIGPMIVGAVLYDRWLRRRRGAE